MRFECNCKTEKEFSKMMDDIHNEKCGVNFEVVARLWYTSIELSKTIMIEHQVSTKECKELTENDDEPDWLTAYEVDDEQDDDCSNEIFTETIETNIKFAGLKESMLDFASQVFERVYQ